MPDNRIDYDGSPIQEIQIRRYDQGRIYSREELVISEKVMTLFVDRHPVLKTAVSPADLDDLVNGFLITEGYADRRQKPELKWEGMICSVCLERIPERDSHGRAVSPKHFLYPADRLEDLADQFQSLPSVYHETGGAHMAALADREIRFWADDIGRRNAVDKVVGKALNAEWDWSESVLFTSCRFSSDLVCKMIRAGLPLLLSLSAPSDKAVRLAEENGITLCGFARNGCYNIYTHPERIIPGKKGNV